MSARRVATSERAFACLIGLFPSEFRDRFGDEMASVFHDQWCDALERAGWRGTTALWLRTIPAIVHAAAAERHEARIAVPRTSRRESMLVTLVADLRFTARMLRKAPSFAIIAVLCIALGSGAVTTIFSAMNAMVLRPLPGAADAGRLVRMERKEPGRNDGISASYQFYEYLQARTRSLDGVVAWGKASLTLRRGGEPGVEAYGNYVSGNFFDVLGVRPALGRFFLPEEARTELTHPVIVLSEAMWKSRFGADSALVGREILVNGHAFTLVGIAPTEFRGLDDPIRTDAWLPVQMQRLQRPGRDVLRDASLIWLRLGGRLREGVTAEDARRELSAIAAAFETERIEPSWMAKYADVRLSMLTGLPPDATGPLAGFLGLLLGAAAIVLVIASVNVAAMLSARAIARRREMAVRAALGAGRGRLVRQLLTEILVLFVLGAAGGMMLAILATNALERLPMPTEIPMALELSPDPRVFAFALLISLATGLLVGLAPALRGAKVDLATRLRDGSLASGHRRSLLGNALVVGQLAVSLVLLVGAGLFVRALQRGSDIDPGVVASGVATAPFNVESWGYDEARGRAFYRELRQRISQTPGVSVVSLATMLPLALRSNIDDVEVLGSATIAGRTRIHYLQVDADYLATLRIPLRSGRDIAARDDATSPKVAVVNETLAATFWPDGSALGRTFTFRGEAVTIIGIARDAKYASLTEATPPLAYLPVAQHWNPRQTLIVRTSGNPRALAPAIGAAVRAIDPGAPRPAVTTLEEAMAVGLLPQRVAAIVTAVLGGVGLLLASVGLYGIIAWSAGARTREIGIRVALGARRADVLRLIAGDGMRLTALGLVVGLAIAALVTRLMTSLLFGVSALDGLTYAIMTVLLAAVGLTASLAPALRATRVDPQRILRSE